ncbi:hypothetical protein BDY19DRAFT_359464 [Irpex rosettiformis]|uniref:Uncharacterized protein n=1 Tax=Irpex rosettiformis TaxID=378272 RepID=A0ACB8TWR2_9APHY|nr:hypothetical protein BDY19DRAFT_359464 [Irpex rosettiformis]
MLISMRQGVRAQVQTVVIPGFGEGVASVSQAGVGSDGSTTLIVSPTPTSGGDFASISGAVTVLAAGSNSEAKFQLIDGSNVDSKCSLNGSQAQCSAVIVNGGATQQKLFATQLPPGFGQFGQQPSITAPVEGPIETVIIPGFGTGAAAVSQGGVGSDGSTTFIVVPTLAAGGDFASIAGPVTILAAGSGSEAKFQLVDGSNVDGKCSINGDQAQCSAVIVNGGATQQRAFQTQLPPGFAQFGATGSSAQPTQTAQSAQSTAQTQSGFSTVVTQATQSESSTSSSAQPSQSGKSNGADKAGATRTSLLLISLALLAGLLL